MCTTQFMKSDSSSKFLQDGMYLWAFWSDIYELYPILSICGGQRPSSQSLPFITESPCKRLPSASQGLKALSLQPDQQTEKKCQIQILFLVD